eukprot:GHVU01039549.1.p2 GENE.GHVU01039549.1~~GHVU01039549.1.p2  ORF type:complete len:109 (-),score=17.30 GHVU01039549.1:257-583(-)
MSLADELAEAELEEQKDAVVGYQSDQSGKSQRLVGGAVGGRGGDYEGRSGAGCPRPSVYSASAAAATTATGSGSGRSAAFGRASSGSFSAASRSPRRRQEEWVLCTLR